MPPHVPVLVKTGLSCRVSGCSGERPRTMARALPVRFTSISRVWLGPPAIEEIAACAANKTAGDHVLEPTAQAREVVHPHPDLRRRMRLGLVTSLVEAGEGEHAGLRRLTARCGAAVWRAVVEADGRVVSQEWGGRARSEPARASGHSGLLRCQREHQFR